MAIANITNNILTDSGVATSSLQPTISLTTTGTSGAATFSANTLNIPQYQGVLTNPVTGTGTTNYLPKFTGTSTIGNSQIFDNGTNVGIGTALPTEKLDVIGGALAAGNGTIRTGITYSSLGLIGTFTNHNLGIITNGTTKLTLDSSGNLGLGVTPSAWRSAEKAIQIGAYTILSDISRYSGFGNNYYTNSSNQNIYLNSDGASLYQQFNSNHYWYNAPSGTAGNAITFTQAMTLTAAGRLLLGTTTESTYLLDVNGTGRFTRMIVGGTATSRILQVNTSGNDGIRILTSGDNPTLDMMQTAAANAAARNWRIVTNWEGWGTMDFQSGTNNTNDPSTTRLSISGTTGAATFSSSCTATSFFESSDSRLKTLIQDNYQTKGIASITPKLYTKNGKVELGYYAQDFVGILDSAVSKGSDDMLSLSYREVHTAKIYALEQEIKELKAKLN